MCAAGALSPLENFQACLPASQELLRHSLAYKRNFEEKRTYYVHKHCYENTGFLFWAYDGF